MYICLLDRGSRVGVGRRTACNLLPLLAIADTSSKLSLIQYLPFADVKAERIRAKVARDRNANAFAGTDQVMTLATHEFIRRFLIHVLPAGFHRIRYYGLLASPSRAANIARARELLAMPLLNQPQTAQHPCPCCGSPMIIIERFERGAIPRYRPSPPIPPIRIDTS